MKSHIALVALAVLGFSGWLAAADQAAPAKPHHTPAQPATPHQAVPPATFTLPAGGKLTETDFLKLLNARCGKCHAQRIKDMPALKNNKWLVPGQPGQSPVYTVIGKHKKAGGTYHNLDAAEKQAIHDFIASLKP